MRRFVAGVLVALLPTGVVAQSALLVQPCFSDSTAHVDTLDLTFMVRAYRGQSSRPDPALTSAFGAMIRPGFVLAPTVTAMFSPYVYGNYHGSPMTTQPFGTLLVSVLGPTDIEVMWDSTTKDAATESALAQATRTAATAKQLQDLADKVGWAALQNIRLMFSAGPDTGVRVALGSIRVPMVFADTPIFAAGGSVNFPKGVSGAPSQEVTLRYLVDEAGQVPLTSIVVIDAPDRRFIPEAINAVRSQKFTPAKSGRCALVQVVDQTVKFTRGGV